MYKDGSIQSFGYDGKWFKTVDDALNNAYNDFKEPIKDVTSMMIVWGNDEFVRHLSTPIWGNDLILLARDYLVGEGIIRDGN